MGLAAAIEQIGRMVLEEHFGEIEKYSEEEIVGMIKRRLLKTPKKGQYLGQSDLDPVANLQHRWYMALDGDIKLTTLRTYDDKLRPYLSMLGLYYIQDILQLQGKIEKYKFLVIPYLESGKVDRCVLDRMRDLAYAGTNIGDVLNSVLDSTSSEGRVYMSFLLFFVKKAERRFEYIIDAVPASYLYAVSELFYRVSAKRKKFGQIYEVWSGFIDSYVQLVHEGADSLSEWKSNRKLEFLVSILSMSRLKRDMYARLLKEYVFKLYSSYVSKKGKQSPGVNELWNMLQFIRAYNLALSDGLLDDLMQLETEENEGDEKEEEEKKRRSEDVERGLLPLRYAFMSGYLFGEIFWSLSSDKQADNRLISVVKHVSMMDIRGLKSHLTTVLARLGLNYENNPHAVFGSYLGYLGYYLARWFEKGNITAEDAAAFILGVLHSIETHQGEKMRKIAPDMWIVPFDEHPSEITADFGLGSLIGAVAYVDKASGRGSFIKNVLKKFTGFSPDLTNPAFWGEALDYYRLSVKREVRVRLPRKAVKLAIAKKVRDVDVFFVFMGVLFGAYAGGKYSYYLWRKVRRLPKLQTEAKSSTLVGMLLGSLMKDTSSMLPGLYIHAMKTGSAVDEKRIKTAIEGAVNGYLLEKIWFLQKRWKEIFERDLSEVLERELLPEIVPKDEWDNCEVKLGKEECERIKNSWWFRLSVVLDNALRSLWEEEERGEFAKNIFLGSLLNLSGGDRT